MEDTGNTDEPRNPTMLNEMDEINDILQQNLDIDNDIPPPESVVQQQFSRPTVLESMKDIANNVTIESNIEKNADSSNNPEILLPKQSKKGVSEFSTKGFFTKAFIELFPDGKGDISITEEHSKTPKLLEWLRHLLRFKDRKFATHPTFILVLVNMLQRHKALTVGNVYAKLQCPDLSFKELKEKILSGDFNALRNLYYFGRDIKGTPQYFGSQATISVNFVRHLKISSGDTNAFNLFLTWSAADHHWPELHRLFPNHKSYLGKKVVKSLSDIPAGEDKSKYIDTKSDTLLRMKNVNENSDIANWFFLKKFKLLVKHIFPILKITDYIARSEFQGRGAIHIHAIVAVAGDVTPKDIELAIKSTDENDCLTEIHSARGKLSDFVSNHIGLVSMHPNCNPSEWPEITKNVTDNECLRVNFQDFYDSEDITKIYESRVNLVQRHKCTPNYCLLNKNKDKVTKHKNKKKVTKHKNNDKVTNEPKCRFKFPKEFHGFDTETDEDNKIISQTRKRIQENNENKDIKTKLKEDEDVAPNGSSIVDGKICPIRNHPTLVQHIKEMLIIWGANTEAQIVTSHRILLMYIVKYVMKPEKPSDAFNRIAKELLLKEGENVPVRKVFSKLLMNSLDRDISRAESFLIAQGGEFVQYSRQPAWVNLHGSKRLKANISSEDDLAMEATDWLQLYAEREENENFITLCNNYPDTFTWDYHPMNISLREFVTSFTKKWEIKNTPTVPVFIPAPKFPVKKKSNSYENWCKFILLSEKPGCYITNVGKEFQSFEEELRQFVVNSEFCRDLIKEDFEESQLESQEDEIPDDISDDEDQLLLSPLENQDEEGFVPTQFQINLLHEDIEQNKDDDVTSDYDADEFEDLTYDWTTDKVTICNDQNYELELQSADAWLKNKKRSMCQKNLKLKMKLIPKNAIKDKKIFINLFVIG